MSKLHYFRKGVLGGVMIAIGGAVYLSCEVTYVGALLFAVGLFTILAFELKLFTGMAGYLPKWEGLLEVWCGNFVGTAFVGLALRLTRVTIIERAVKVCTTKLDDTPWSIFILAVFCGALMFIAVDYFKRTKNYLAVFLAVPAFILASFEHCIANMFYITLAGMWSMKALLYLLIMTAGNAVGAWAFRVLSKPE